jgi:dipeptidyl aminopeptidase/acylaminoacyl peptidase
MFPDWSPDGRSIAFESDMHGNRMVYAIDSGGGVPRQLSAAPSSGEVPHWSRDGRFVLFEADGNDHRMWQVPRDGGPATPTDEARFGREDADGSFRYFVEDAGGRLAIRRQARSGAPIQTIVEDATEWSFGLGARGLYFARNARPDALFASEIAFHDFVTRQTTKVVDLHPGTRTGASIRVSTDGRFLYYTQCDQETDDLMLVENFR